MWKIMFIFALSGKKKWKMVAYKATNIRPSIPISPNDPEVLLFSIFCFKNKPKPNVEKIKNNNKK